MVKNPILTLLRMLLNVAIDNLIRKVSGTDIEYQIQGILNKFLEDIEIHFSKSYDKREIQYLYFRYSHTMFK